jgi:hypothetical protein
MVHWIRHEKVILDVHLAGLYEVETRALKQAVRRNRDRFPGDFLFELTAAEMDALVSQSVIPSRKNFGGAAPYAFTEQGAAILHDEAKRKNIPTAEYQSVVQKSDANPVRVAYERRNRDSDRREFQDPEPVFVSISVVSTAAYQAAMAPPAMKPVVQAA